MHTYVLQTRLTRPVKQLNFLVLPALAIQSNAVRLIESEIRHIELWLHDVDGQLAVSQTLFA